jgi:hypothetical protein
LFDGGGLYLEVLPAGGKYWCWKYRFAGKEKRLALGVYPEVSLKEARDGRDEVRRLLRQRIDPSEHRKLTQSARVHTFKPGTHFSPLFSLAADICRPRGIDGKIPTVAPEYPLV